MNVKKFIDSGLFKFFDTYSVIQVLTSSVLMRETDNFNTYIQSLKTDFDFDAYEKTEIYLKTMSMGDWNDEYVNRFFSIIEPSEIELEMMAKIMIENEWDLSRNKKVFEFANKVPAFFTILLEQIPPNFEYFEQICDNMPAEIKKIFVF